MLDELKMGVTTTGGSAGAGNSNVPHIHNKSWWDDQILYPYLFKGKSMGEILLMNQMHLEWITTFVGDPLYHWPAGETKDNLPPDLNLENAVKVGVSKTAEGKKTAWVRVSLKENPEQPETAQLRAIGPDAREVVSQTFDSRPVAILGEPSELFDKQWKLEMVDPYGNKKSVQSLSVNC